MVTQGTSKAYVETEVGFLPEEWNLVKLEDALREVDLRLVDSNFEEKDIPGIYLFSPLQNGAD